ncbi:MAG TPA: DUF4838 domain-containing protein [Chitinophagaceae bacterium]|nr:DUF4838 domain-containing protein [Chitinophagaceae bacterium]
MKNLARLFSLLAIVFFFFLKSQAQTVEIVKTGKSNYQLILPANPDSNETKAALALQKYINESSGVQLAIVNKANKNRNIFIGTASPAFKELSKKTYNWKSDKKGLHIVGATPYQTLEATYAFLEQVLGCKFLSPSVEYVPRKADIVLTPADNFSYNPRITTRTVHARLFYDNPEFAAKRRVTTEGFPSFVPEARVHTFHRFIPEKQYYKSNPEFYALVKGKRLPTQVCLSNDTVYRMIRDSVKVFFQRSPNAKVISVSQDDNTQYCTCDRCAAIDTKEGTPAASMILFINKIAREFPDKTIATLAYQYTRHAPKTIKPEKNTLITLCSIECDRSGPISEKCKDFEKDLKEWGALGSTIQIWDYTTQFTNFLAPFPNMETLKPNINLFVDNGANWIFEQHSHNPSDLYEMRCYIMSRLLWDPSLSYSDLLNEFSNAFYGAAGPAVAKYVNELHASIQAYPSFYLFLYGDPAQGFNSWLSGDKLVAWNKLFDDAETSVGGNADLVNRIHAARIGLDFATLEYYRLNKEPYLLSDKAAIEKRLNRFEQTATANKMNLMNEMGLPRTDYVNAYRNMLTNMGAVNLAKGAKVTVKNKPVKYAKEDPQTLTDGAFGGWSFYANWLGFLDTLDATIDLGKDQSFSNISISFLQVTNHVVFYPTRVVFQTSLDGRNFSTVETVENPYPLTPQSKINDIYNFSTAPQTLQARYIRIIAHNMNTPPYWHHAAGTGAWIFADEVVVR